MRAAAPDQAGISAAGDNFLSIRESSILRVDSFDCPADHASAFEDRLSIIHGYFDTLPGCLYNRIATRAGESENVVKFVTMVEWRDRAALDDAKTAVSAFYAKSDFNPAKFMEERGIKGDFGTYLPVAH